MRKQILVVLSVLLLTTGIYADDNAGARSRGAQIKITSANKTRPVNDRWNKVEGIINDENPKGPIIHKLNTAEITISLAFPLHVTKVGILSADYKGGFAMAKDITISAPGAKSKNFTLTQDDKVIQYFPFAAKTDQVMIKVSSIYPPKNAKKPKLDYGTINNIQILVSEDLDKLFSPPKTYQAGLPVYIMRTVNLDPQGFSGVIGQPRKVKGHPYTIWDADDIAEFKAQIKKYPQAKKAYEGIIAFCEKACQLKRQVPDKPDDGVDKKLANEHSSIATSIANLGIGYALSGNEKYAAEGKRLLLQLADKYEGWPIHKHPKFSHDSAKWSWQRLNEAIWLIPAAWGFDLIYNSKSMTEADASKIKNHFIMPCVRSIMRSASIIAAPTNWSVIANAAVMIGSRVSGNEEFFQKSINGLGKKPGKKGGIYFHLDKGIDDDGMWGEGAMGYQMMAIRGLLVAAEILWHDGIDVYSYNNGRLKLVFDSPIWYSYPGGKNSPAVHDSGSSNLFGRDAHLYQYALRRYGDKTYNAILSKITPTFESVYNLFLPACDFAPVDAADLPSVPSIIFPGVGFTINRTGAGDDSKYLFMDYGPNRSHGHADKLNFALFALGQELFCDPGAAWYSTDLYKKYYPYSQAHNTVTANEMSQIKTEGKLEAYGTLGNLALVRASCDTAVPAVVLDRTMFLSDSRLYDIFMVKSGIPFTLDLPYRSPGVMNQTIAEKPWKDHPKKKNGYCYFKDTVAADVPDNWQCSWLVKNGRMNMYYAGEKGTEVIFSTTPKGAADLPTVMVRRKGKETIYTCGIDLVPNGKKNTIAGIKKLTAEGNLAGGLLCNLVDGGQEILLTNFTGNKQQIGDWLTDARVAFIKLKSGKLDAFYLAGGTFLKGNNVDIKVSVPTLLAYRRVKDGLAQLSNQGEKDCEIRISGIPETDKIRLLDKLGRRISANPAKKSAGTLLLTAKAYHNYELTKGKQPSVAEFEEKLRRSKINAQLAREKIEKDAFLKQVKQQYAAAEKNKVPKDYFVLIQAEKPLSETGGKIKITSKKAATYGDAFMNWNNHGHAIEYEFEVLQDGYYQIVLKYCREGGAVNRAIQVNGKYPFAGAKEFEMAGTGGWSNGADNWKLFPITWPLIGKPFLVKLKAGKNKIKVINIGGGGLNLDYIVVAAPFMKVTKKIVEKH